MAVQNCGANATLFHTPQILPTIPHGMFQQPPTSSNAHASALSLSAHHNQLGYHHQKQKQQQQEVEICWANQLQGIEEAVEFRNHSFPLARIKKIMKSDEQVRMISAEAPVVFAKACEMFINELTLRAWNHTGETKRRTLQKNDIAAAINGADMFDFLIDIFPRDESKEDQLTNLATPASSISVGSCSSNAGGVNSFPYYYLPNQHSAPHGVIAGKPMDPAIYMQQSGASVGYMQNMLQRGFMYTEKSRSPNSG